MKKTLTPEKLLDIIGDPGPNPLNTTGATILQRLTDINSNTSTTKLILYIPTNAEIYTTDILTASAVYTSTTKTYLSSRLGHMAVIAYSDVDGTIAIEGSIDATNWDIVLGTQALTGGTGTSLNIIVPCQYVRAKYTNGATDQTVFRFGGRYYI